MGQWLAAPSVVGPAADPRIPNLFILGAPKAGTTFLHLALRLVRSVYMSAVKEPGYFVSVRDQRRGLSHYLDDYFARASGHPIRGESTPWCLYSERALEGIGALPTAEATRFVVLVRRPSARVRSMYLDQVRLNSERRTFEEAADEVLETLAASNLAPDVRRRYVCGRALRRPHRAVASRLRRGVGPGDRPGGHRLGRRPDLVRAGLVPGP